MPGSWGTGSTGGDNTYDNNNGDSWSSAGSDDATPGYWASGDPAYPTKSASAKGAWGAEGQSGGSGSGKWSSYGADPSSTKTWSPEASWAAGATDEWSVEDPAASVYVSPAWYSVASGVATPADPTAAWYSVTSGVAAPVVPITATYWTSVAGATAGAIAASGVPIAGAGYKNGTSPLYSNGAAGTYVSWVQYLTAAGAALFMFAL